jgi:hypothetical protein
MKAEEDPEFMAINSNSTSPQLGETQHNKLR